jgi:hypothetical protein
MMSEDCRGAVRVDARSLTGIGHQHFAVAPPFPRIPLSILTALEDGFSVRFGIATTTGGRVLDLGALFAIWRPRVVFDQSTDWRNVIAAEAQTAIREALASFSLTPAFIIDAAAEVWGAWPLSTPLAVDHDPSRALTLLSRLAETLGAADEAARDLTITLPIAGHVRNFGMQPPFVEIIDVDPPRRYALDEIEAALTPTTETTRKRGACS